MRARSTNGKSDVIVNWTLSGKLRLGLQSMKLYEAVLGFYTKVSFMVPEISLHQTCPSVPVTPARLVTDCVTLHDLTDAVKLHGLTDAITLHSLIDCVTLHILIRHEPR